MTMIPSCHTQVCYFLHTLYKIDLLFIALNVPSPLLSS